MVTYAIFLYNIWVFDKKLNAKNLKRNIWFSKKVIYIYVRYVFTALFVQGPGGGREKIGL